MGCANLFQFVPVSQPSMSQHLRVLVEAGLAESHKEGRNVYLAINIGKAYNNLLSQALAEGGSARYARPHCHLGGRRR